MTDLFWAIFVPVLAWVATSTFVLHVEWDRRRGQRARADALAVVTANRQPGDGTDEDYAARAQRMAIWIQTGMWHR